MVVAFVMALSNIALAGWVVKTDVREKVIITPPNLGRAFWIQGDEVSPEYLEQMATWFTSLALTYNPDNIEHMVFRTMESCSTVTEPRRAGPQ